MHYFRYDLLGKCKSGGKVLLERAEHNHLFRILRASAGEEIALLDGLGRIGLARIESGQQINLLSVKEVSVPETRLHLYVAPPRKQKNDQILKQSTELGVWRIVPFLSERSVSQPDEDSVSGRWESLLFEACKQSANPFLPKLSAPITFKDAVQDAKSKCGKCFFGSPRHSAGLFTVSGDVAFFVGPEGGFSAEEEIIMLEASFIPLQIGQWTLRVETACIAGVALLLGRCS